MLQDELGQLTKLVFDRKSCPLPGWTSADNLEEECKRISAAWLKAAFYTLPDDALKRYFNHQLLRLSALSDSLFEIPHAEKENRVIVELICGLKLNHHACFSAGLTAPKAYHQAVVIRLAPRIAAIKQQLKLSRVNHAFQSCISAYLKEMSEEGVASYTFSALDYFEDWVLKVFVLCQQGLDVETRLRTALLTMNFNHLGFIAYWQAKVKDGQLGGRAWITHLQEEKARLSLVPDDLALCYHSQWPSAKCLINGWLSEELAAAEQEIRLSSFVQTQPVLQKLPLNLSVAQLACLIKMLYEENQIGTTNLTVIFKFFSSHFQTRRQPEISLRSLSKEFYSVSQVTAAGVQGLFQKIVTRINRNFFPG
jgi:hypothetical protein